MNGFMYSLKGKACDQKIYGGDSSSNSLTCGSYGWLFKRKKTPKVSQNIPFERRNNLVDRTGPIGFMAGFLD
jgi:hypothetical protein